MSLFNFSRQLLKTTAPAGGAIGPSTDQTGTTYVCLAPRYASDRAFKVLVELQASGGASSPTATVHVETSHDGATWIAAIDPITQAGDGTKRELADAPAILSHVRARTVLAGGTAPAHKAVVVLLSNADITLKG